MQINNTLPSSNISSDLGVSPQSQKSNPRQSGGGDSVQISSLASHFSADSSKLSGLQAAYDAGKYNIPPGQIATSIMNDAFLR